jgi:outer membrane protein OmpA-like peptidoglycan-associated protein
MPDVSESTLIQALSLDPPVAASGATRGFRPLLRTDGAAPPTPASPPKPAGAGRASVLITFSTNSAELTPESMVALDTVGRALQSESLAKYAFGVEGHADRRGDPEANRLLSLARAESVVAYLVKRHAMRPDRLKAEGKGSTEPMNAERIDAPENRRVTIVTLRS